MPLILPYKKIMPTIAPGVFIAENATVIGDTEIGEKSSIWFGCVLRGDVNVIRVGSETNIQDGTVVHVASQGQGSFIGDRVTIGHMALIHACTIEDDCLIGMKACVMDDAYIEKGAMVAAGALVPPGKRVKAGELWAGVPARKIRDVSEDEAAWIAHSATHYASLAAEYLASIL